MKKLVYISLLVFAGCINTQNRSIKMKKDHVASVPSSSANESWRTGKKDTVAEQAIISTAQKAVKPKKDIDTWDGWETWPEHDYFERF